MEALKVVEELTTFFADFRLELLDTFWVSFIEEETDVLPTELLYWVEEGIKERGGLIGEKERVEYGSTESDWMRYEL